MKQALPADARVTQSAKQLICDGASEMIALIASEASERIAAEERRLMTAEDVLYAMQKLGFDAYMEPLRSYLEQYRAVVVR